MPKTIKKEKKTVSNRNSSGKNYRKTLLTKETQSLKNSILKHMTIERPPIERKKTQHSDSFILGALDSSSDVNQSVDESNSPAAQPKVNSVELEG